MKPTKEEMSRIGKSNVRRSKTHERKVAHLLQNFTGVEFRRRRVEGRDTTVVERESTADVIPVKGNILFSIEAKCGEPTSWDGLLSNPHNNQFTKWWHQTTFDARILTEVLKREIYPLLFFKPHPNFDWIAIDQKVFKDGLLRDKDNKSYLAPWFTHLTFDSYENLGFIRHDVSHSKKNKVMVELELPNLYFIRWKDFESNVLPSSIFVNGE